MATKTPSYATLTGLDWLPPWIKAREIAWAAPQVIAYRTARMMWGGWPPSARDQREYTRMGQEKADAISQVLMAAAVAWPVTGAKALQQMLAPVHRRVTANHRRLARG